MNVLIDTCVIIDFLQRRAPYCEDAHRIMQYAGAEAFVGGITVKSALDIYYLTRKCTHSEKESRTTLNKLLSIVGLLGTSAEDLLNAISSDVSDFEDAVMVETGLRVHVDCIVTRNIKDFAKSPLPIYSPSKFLQTVSR